MTDEIIRLAVVEKETIESQPKQYEVVREQVERFTVEQIDSEIASLNARITELKAKKTKALAIDK